MVLIFLIVNFVSMTQVVSFTGEKTSGGEKIDRFFSLFFVFVLESAPEG